MTERFANNAQTTLAAKLAKGATMLTVASAASFPDGGDFRILIGGELMMVTDVSGSEFTIERAIEETAEEVHGAGAEVIQIVTAGLLSSVASGSTITGDENGLAWNADKGEWEPASVALGGVTIHNAKGLRRWAAARGKALFSLAKVSVFGDSVTVGAGSSDTWRTGEEATAAQKLEQALRSFVSQLRALLNQQTGVDAGEGWITFGSDEGRWSYTGEHSNQATGPASTGTLLAAGGVAYNAGATALFKFGQLVFYGYSVSTAAMPSRILANGKGIIPSSLAVKCKEYKVEAGGWEGGDSHDLISTGEEAGEPILKLKRLLTAGTTRVISPSGVAGFAVTPGQKFIVKGEIKGISVARKSRVTIKWYKADGTEISEFGSPEAKNVVGSYMQYWSIAEAPANAAFAAVLARVTDAGQEANEEIYIRRLHAVPVTTAAGKSGVTLYKFTCYADESKAQELKIEGSPSVGAPTEGGQGTYISGISLRSGTAAATGALISRVGKSGSTTKDHVGALYSENTQLNLLQSAITFPGMDLAVIALGINDAAKQTEQEIPVATYKANLKKLCALVVEQGGCVLLLGSPRLHSETAPATQIEYYDAAKEIALTEEHVAYVDLMDLWGTEALAESLGFQNNALYGVHPSLAGHGDYGRMLFVVLSLLVGQNSPVG